MLFRLAGFALLKPLQQGIGLPLQGGLGLGRGGRTALQRPEPPAARQATARTTVIAVAISGSRGRLDAAGIGRSSGGWPFSLPRRRAGGLYIGAMRHHPIPPVTEPLQYRPSAWCG
ncbi:hypothetical protein, partial [Synechococcus sp. GFB01]|uniref:hypothetical protein n=1 Tax=Synechococcus sp. GFB01 TaxID=1662190 RepID=UPI00128C35E8